MKRKPMTLLQFQKQYRTEDDCLQALEQMRWPNGFVCSKCGHDDGYRLNRQRIIECSLCKTQTSITAGTVFHKTRIPLINWFWMIFLVATDKRGSSGLRLSKQLDMHYSTVWHILHKIRRAMSLRDTSVIKLSGVIQLDEGFFGGHKRKTQFLVMVEGQGRKAGSIVMKRIFGAKVPSGPGIEAAIEAHVDNESQQHFIADQAWAHSSVKKMGHILESHKSTPKSAVTNLGWLHMAISLAKQFLLGTYHGVSRKHMQYYLDEFCFRYNRRFKEDLLHESLLRACLLAPPIPYPVLTR
jgi:hypothetical protein